MKWILTALALLIAGLLLKLSLLVYAMYVLLGVLLLSRFFARAWVERLHVSRSTGPGVFEIGDATDVEVEVENRGALSVPWLLLEDSLPRDAMIQMPQRLKAQGARLALTRLSP